MEYLTFLDWILIFALAAVILIFEEKNLDKDKE